MGIFDVLTMIGGLALFLYGMNAMGDGLAKVSGGKLEQWLEKLTSSPIKGVLLGAGVTAIIQSSSATTVMVVGFVNSGIMKLSQAIGIIMGANVGTTVTSWILSLTGIQSDNIIIQLLKPTSFTPILALIGIIFILFAKSDKKKDIGTIMVGFAILMFGMDTMSGAVDPLAENEKFQNIMTMFSNPLLGLLAGTILTAIIQSSSASVGILQALCLTGAVKYGVALPIIMGQNIGTCITAILSSIGASKNAKRAAMVHLYFNLIGTVTFMVIFYTINLFAPFGFLNEAAGVSGIAVIHSVFNIATTMVLLPFAHVIERLAVLTIRDDENESMDAHGIQRLDPRFLDTPAFAIEQCKNATMKMAKISCEALIDSIHLIGNYDEKKAEDIVVMEDHVDHYEDELGSYLVKVSGKNLTQNDSKTVSMLLHCIGDFERISDHAVNIMESAKEMQEKNLEFSEQAKGELEVFSRAITDIVTASLDVFEKQDVVLAKTIEPLEEVVDYLNSKVKQRHIDRLRSGECTIELGFILSDLTTNFERVADHCSNIAVCLIQLHDNGFETHEYMEVLKSSKNEKFREDYLARKQMYQLP